MKFNKILDFLMNITKTTNSTLAHQISLDPSFISRLRRGVRIPSKNENYLKAMATYFARNFSEEYQLVALREAIGRELTDSKDELMELIHQWLLEGKAYNTHSIDVFLDNLTQFNFKKVPQVKILDMSETSTNIKNDTMVYYGVKGKQTAVLTFLSLVLKNKTPQTLLLYSDEDLAWLTQNPEFTQKWAVLLSQVIMAGNRIKIIHTVNRSLDEMLSAIDCWLPMYMTGAIEPYYYSKTRDGVYKRTLFIAPETAVVASSSIGNEAENAANFLYTNKPTIKALTEEFHAYLNLCRPLMGIFTPNSNAGYMDTLLEFEEQEASTLLKTDYLSNISIPMNVLQDILSPLEENLKKKILTYHQIRIENLYRTLQKCRFTEIINLPDLGALQRGEIKVSFSDMIGKFELYYTKSQFMEHLQNVIQLAEDYDYYNFYISSDVKSSGYMLYVKEDVGIFVAKTSTPSVTFSINEGNMTSAFWDYMMLNLHKIQKNKTQKKLQIQQLKEFLSMLSF